MTLRIVLGLMALSGVALACRSDGGDLSLEEYFQRLGAINRDTDERLEALDIGAYFEMELEELDSEEDAMRSLQGFFESEYLSIEREHVDALNRMNAPPEVEDVHRELVAATTAAVESIAAAIDKVDSIAEWLEIVEHPDELTTSESARISDRLNNVCISLLEIVNQNDVRVSLEC